MQLEIARPWALLLLPVFAGIVIWSAGRLRSRSRTRRIGETLMRCLVMALVVFAVSGMSIRKSSDMTTTIFLVDLSDSVKSVRAEETEFIQSAIAEMPDKNQAGIVVFGSDAQIEQFVSEKKAFTDFQSEVTATATNLEQAIQTALALFPDGNACRLVLLTDGAENEGSVSDLSYSFTASDIELKVVRYDSRVEKEVYISNVSLPETIHQGDQFQVQVDIYSTEATEAKVSLYSGRTLKGQKEVILQKGNNQLVFSDEGLEGGLKSYRVTVEAEQDTVSVNNIYSAFTTVEARPKLLVVEGEKDLSREFQSILKACNYDYDVVTPSGVPGQISDMVQYKSAILIDVYADDLRKGFMDMVQTWVKDYAGGLVAIGGRNSFALGNYRNTPLEEILPVKMDLEGEKQIPKLAMTMVIDHSGSMSSSSTQNGSITCMDVAKQAAVNALDSLREIDEVGVLAFDSGYTWAVPLQEAADTEEIAAGIAGITANGGTSIYPALAEAVSKMKDSDAPLKHIVLLTDGQDGFHEYGDLLKKMDQYGITLSTVAVGADADTGTLADLAEKGGGRYYYSDAGTVLPRIFAQEVYLSVKSYLIDEEFTPVITNSHEIIEGIFTDGSPSLLGYIASTAKPTATVILESDREDPILSVWQYGLGRTVAWNSDGTNQWTGNFAGWDQYASLWRNIIDWTISGSDPGEDTLQVKQEASSAVITYKTEDYSAKTSISAVITGEDGSRQEVKLKVTSPGVYSAQVPLSETGVYSINVRNQDGKEIIKNINTATAMQYSQEYRYADVSGSLDSFVQNVSGRYIEKPEEVFDTKLTGSVSRKDLTEWLLFAAVFLFVLDVIARRMRVDWLAEMENSLKKAKLAVQGRAASGRLRQKSTADGRKRGGKTDEQDMSGQVAEGTGGHEISGQKTEGQGEHGKPGNSDNAEKISGENSQLDKSGKESGKAPDKKHDRRSARKSGRKSDPERNSIRDDSVIDTSALLKKKRDRDL
ncbi:MAG: VWA domain-containing protein [Lachnospiraceae bacterium]|nr:VWA domain-containing protein [Lachnospiraceae bacterium]